MSASPTPRVASLLPAATEIVALFGDAAHLVGRSHECDHPPGVEDLPVLTRSRVGSIGGSGTIDRDVRRVLQDALAVYEVETDALATASPEVVVTQDLCDVCAVSLDEVERAVAEVLDPSVRIVNLHPTRLDDLWEDVRRVGSALKQGARAEDWILEGKARLSALAERTTALGTRPRVLTLEWLDPVMVGGTWMPELVEIAGGEALVTKAGQHAPTLDRGALAGLDPAPEVVLVKPCGFELERTRRESGALAELLATMPWPAVRDGRIYVADGNAYFNRPGPRLIESAEVLAACIHPNACADLAARHRDAFEAFPAA